jgi:AdoMet-dependent rRNA methyltransferase SPB1
MQLQMTAPLDIGLEQTDASLRTGQEDVFDLTGAEQGLRKRGGISKLASDDEMPSDEEELEVVEEESDDEVLDSEEERERKVSALEADLDGMYDVYQEKLKERDAKYRVMEARKKGGALEEWGGLNSKAGGESEDDSSEGGGWDEMEAAKETGDNSSSDESDDEEPAVGQKRKRSDHTPSKNVGLVRTLQPPHTSRAAQVWFSQDVFKDLDEPSEDEAEDVEMSSNSGGSQQGGWQDEVYRYPYVLSYITDAYVKSESDMDDFNIVPTEPDGDVEMWNAEDENPDDVKRAHIQSRSSQPFPGWRGIDLLL